MNHGANCWAHTTANNSENARYEVFFEEAGKKMEKTRVVRVTEVGENLEDVDGAIDIRKDRG